MTPFFARCYGFFPLSCGFRTFVGFFPMRYDYAKKPKPASQPVTTRNGHPATRTPLAACRSLRTAGSARGSALAAKAKERGSNA